MAGGDRRGGLPLGRGALPFPLDPLGPDGGAPGALHPGAARSRAARHGPGSDRFSPGGAVGPLGGLRCQGGETQGWAARQRPAPTRLRGEGLGERSAAAAAQGRVAERSLASPVARFGPADGQNSERFGGKVARRSGGLAAPPGPRGAHYLRGRPGRVPPGPPQCPHLPLRRGLRGRAAHTCKPCRATRGPWPGWGSRATAWPTGTCPRAQWTSWG